MINQVNINNSYINSYIFSLLILIITIFCLYNIEGFDTYFKNNKWNDKNYEIQKTNDDDQKVANLIGYLDEFITDFVEYLKEKHPDDKAVKRLVKNIESTKYKESEFEKNTSSYTINKGELISICLRHTKMKIKHTHNINTLKFVIIHELGHVMSLSTGHTTEWYNYFKFLLKEAHKANLYKPIDYSKNNINYCGVDVTHNPYFDY